MSMNFEQMVQKILETSNLSRDEVMSKIRGKQEELSGFVTLEGAANIIARELGIVFEREEPEVRALQIEDLIPGMSKADILARIARVREPREFQRANGKPGQVGSLTLMDRTGEIRLVLWNDKASLLKEGELKKGDVIKVRNAYVRQGIDKRPELSLGSRGSLILNPDDTRARDLPSSVEARVKVADLRLEMIEVDIVGRVAATSEIRTFDRPDGTTGKVSTLLIMDGSGQVRVSLWDEWAELAKGLKRGEVVLLENANVRSGLGGNVELSLGSGGRLISNPSDVPDLPQVRERPLKLNEVEADMRSVDLVARVRRKFPTNEFKRADGSTGRVASVILADDTRTIRASFWDISAGLVEGVKVNDVLRLQNAYARAGLGGRPELHVGKSTKVEINPPGVEVAELGPRPVKIGEIEPNDDSIEVVGRVTEVSPSREFTRPDGSKGKVASILVGDESGTIRVSLWQDHAASAERLKVGDAVKLFDGYTTLGLLGQPELHLGKQGKLELSPDVELPQVDSIKAVARPGRRLGIAEIEGEGMQVQVRGTVVQVFHRRPIFDVCPECGRTIAGTETALACEACGKTVLPEHRAVISLLLDDGTDNIRAVMFGDVAERLLGMTSKQVSDAFKSKPDIAEFYHDLKLVGRELLVYGTTRRDRYFDQIEIRASEVRVPDPLQEASVMLKRLKEMA